MKMYLMTFNEACKAYSKAYPMTADFTNKRLFGIGKKSIPWGKNVEVDINTFRNGHTPTYQLNGFSVPACVFKVDNENIDKEPPVKDVLHYGKVLTNDPLYDRCDEMAAIVRVKIMSYQGNVYYVKKVDGEVVEFKKVGVVG